MQRSVEAEVVRLVATERKEESRRLPVHALVVEDEDRIAAVGADEDPGADHVAAAAVVVEDRYESCRDVERFDLVEFRSDAVEFVDRKEVPSKVVAVAIVEGAIDPISDIEVKID